MRFNILQLFKFQVGSIKDQVIIFIWYKNASFVYLSKIFRQSCKIVLKVEVSLESLSSDDLSSGLNKSLMAKQVKTRRQDLLLLLMLLIGCAAIDPSLNGHTMPLYGNDSLGYYYTYLYMGTPPQQQSVIVDTGSNDLAVTCSLCTTCNDRQINPYFDLAKSSTSKVSLCPQEEYGPKCPFFVEYGDGSTISGQYISDNIQFDPHSVGKAFPVPFGCTLNKTYLMSDIKANGIWGLAPSWKDLSLLSHKISHKMFNEQNLLSVCLGKNGGQMMIGSRENELTKGIEPANATFNASSFFYSLNEVGKIRIGDATLRDNEPLGRHGIFIDSGSTITTFGTRQFELLNQQITSTCTRHFDRCGLAPSVNNLTCFYIYLGFGETMQQVVSRTFPNIEIEIGGKVVSWPPERYFRIRKEYDGFTCLGVKSKSGLFILGANWMINRNIVFSIEHHTIQIYSDVRCSESNEVGKAEGIFGGVDIKVSKDNVELKIVVFVLLYLMLGGRIYCIRRSQRRKEQYQRNISSIVVGQLQENGAVRH